MLRAGGVNPPPPRPPSFLRPRPQADAPLLPRLSSKPRPSRGSAARHPTRPRPSSPSRRSRRPRCANPRPGLRLLGCKRVADASLSATPSPPRSTPLLPAGTVAISAITSRPARASRRPPLLRPARNWRGHAAVAALVALGVRLARRLPSLAKGRPLGSGLASAASAAAAAKAVDALFGSFRSPATASVLPPVPSPRRPSADSTPTTSPRPSSAEFVMVRSDTPSLVCRSPPAGTPPPLLRPRHP
ncbi:hypothetical protein ZWY2020_024605 [Hordeum vulgare]|nr:hypothetical protein ZWY2020_024605 [Hordeum vulgare]